MFDKTKLIEKETLLAEFRRKMNGRLSIIGLISGILFLIPGILGFNYYGLDNLFELLSTIQIVAGISLCALAIMNPFIDKRKISRPHYVPPPPIGWGQFVLTVVLCFLLTLNRIFSVLTTNSRIPIDQYNFINSIFFLALVFMIIVATFLVGLPQAIRSVCLNIQLFRRENNGLKKSSLSINCLRDEAFRVIIARLQNNFSFKRRLAKLQIAPTPDIQLVYHNEVLTPESTPAQHDFKRINHIAVTLE